MILYVIVELTNGEINMSKPVLEIRSIILYLRNWFRNRMFRGSQMVQQWHLTEIYILIRKIIKQIFLKLQVRYVDGFYIHEMTHVMQYQNGINVLANGLLFQTGKILSVGLYDPYKFSYALPGKAFGAYNLEQQEIARGIYYGKLQVLS